MCQSTFRTTFGIVFNAYFLQKAMQDQRIDFQEAEKSILGTEHERQPPQKAS